jgi:hypothetical protein
VAFAGVIVVVGILIVVAAFPLVVIPAGLSSALISGVPALIAGAFILAALPLICVAGASPARTGISTPAALIRINDGAFTLTAPLRRGRRLHAEGEQACQREAGRDS